MPTADSHAQVLRNLLASQLLGVLSTHGESGPYASLVAFAASEDLRSILFTTARSTRKAANLAQDDRAAMLIDNRSNDPTDFADAAAATAVGRVVEVRDAERAAEASIFVARHPYLDRFVDSPTCLLLRLEVERYLVVTRFQHVMELRVDR